MRSHSSSAWRSIFSPASLGNWEVWEQASGDSSSFACSEPPQLTKKQSLNTKPDRKGTPVSI